MDDAKEGEVNGTGLFCGKAGLFVERGELFHDQRFLREMNADGRIHS